MTTTATGCRSCTTWSPQGANTTRRSRRRRPALLAEIGPDGPGRDVVLDTFFARAADDRGNGAVLILDDFHLVDDAADVRHITRELLARAPERLTHRVRQPSGAGRSVGQAAGGRRGGGARDGRAAVRCRRDRAAVHRDLRPAPRADVLADLAERTEGWIASLQLVQAALRDRSPAEIRRFVRSLNGADHEMYDYLAEEVVGDLDEDLQRFLMETSILQVVTPELAEVVSDAIRADVAKLTAAAERLTLLSRLSGGPRTHQRYHPLVREFLEARFRAYGWRRGGGGSASTDRGRRRGNGLADRRVPLSRGGRHGRRAAGGRRRDPNDHGQRPVRPRGDLHRLRSPPSSARPAST